LIAAVLFCALLGQASAVREPVTIDRILAVVSNQPIMLSDVSAAIGFGLIELPSATNDPTGAALDRLIRRRLILAEVERYQPPEPDPVEITIAIDAIEKRLGSAAAFDRTLAVTGLTRDQLRHYLRDDLRITTYLNQRFGAERDPDQRAAQIEKWVGDLRRRTQITVLPRTP
jgi:hypothetical protein